MRLPAYFTGLLLLALAPAALAAGLPGLAPGEHWLAATLDHRHAGITILVHQPPAGEPHFRVIDLDQLGIPYRGEQRFRHRAEDYVSAGALTLHEAHIDPLAGRAHFVTRLRPHSPAGVPSDLLLDVRVNGVLIGQPLYVQNTGSDLVLPRETLEALRVALPRAYGPFLEDSLPVHALAGENFFLALDRLYLEMTVPAEDFEVTQLSPQGIWAGAVPDWSPSFVLGYNLSGGEDVTGERWHAGLADVAISSGTASCRSRHLAQSWQDESVRLDSACILDWPTVPLSAGIGDNYSAGGSMHQTVAYGGFWIGTDYSLQPYRNLQPSLIVDGNARLPSTLEIWMDQQLGLRQAIPPGPFVVDNLPAVTGAGNLRAILVDATGRQVLISAPVYSDPRLLGPGIFDWRIEAGRLRPGLFSGDDHYTDRFASAGARFGITGWLTGELHAERTDAFTNGAVATAFRVSHFGLFEAGVSQSRNELDQATAQATLYGYSWRGKYLHASWRDIRRDADYLSLGYPVPGSAPTRERTLSAGVALPGVSVTLSAIEREFEDREEQRLGNAGVAIRLGNFGQLLLSTTRDLSRPDSDALYSAHLTIPLGARAHTSHSFSRQGDVNGASNSFGIRPPTDRGAGFRVIRDALAGDERYFAEARYRGTRAQAGVSARTSPDGETSWETRLDGAIVASRAGIGLARDDGNSFAMIETGPGAGGIRVLRENQEVTRTGAGGSAIVSGLRAYESNGISLRQEDLPLSSELDTGHLGIVPGRRGVVVADFGYRQERQLMARLVLPPGSGSTIPAGSEVFVDGAPAGLVGFDGTVYLVVPQREEVVIEVRWPKGSCTATAELPPGQGIEVAGDMTCHPE